MLDITGPHVIVLRIFFLHFTISCVGVSAFVCMCVFVCIYVVYVHMLITHLHYFLEFGGEGCRGLASSDLLLVV